MMRKFFVRFLCFFGLCFLVLTGTLSYGLYKLTRPQVADIHPGTVLKLTLDTPLQEMPSAHHFPFQQDSSTSLREIIDTLKMASQDTRVQGLTVHLDNIQFSGLAQIQELRNAIHDFRKTGKFAHVYCDSFGEISSGMGIYYLATAFDQIWMAPLGSLNITGLSTVQPFARRLLDELGIQPEIEAREEYKTAYDSALKSEMSVPHRQEVQEMLDSFMNQMIKAIARDRKLNQATVIDAINKAPHFDLIPVKQQGFIDQISYLPEFYKSIQKTSKASWLDFHQYVASVKQKVTPSDTKIAVIFGSGMIAPEGQRSNPLMPSMSMEVDDIKRAFKLAGRSSDIKAVVFRIDSPGGSPLISDDLWNTIREFQKLSQKPVIVSMGNVAASGGYWIAACADKIVANPGSITGSIGVLSGKIASAKLWEKLNVQWDIVKTHPNAAIWNMIYPFSPEEKQLVSNMTDHIYKTFIQKVAEGRHLSVDHVRQVAKGRVWTGEQALQAGLVDQLGDLNTAIYVAMQEAKFTDAQKNHAHVLYLPEHASLLTKLSNLTKGNFKISIFMSQVIELVIQQVQLNLMYFQNNQVKANINEINY
ncbi:MAG: signal peptide peptidase SppA [Janthinobacterium lividum]